MTPPYCNSKGYADPTAAEAIKQARVTIDQYRSALDRDMSEAQHQTQLFAEIKALTSKYPDLEWCYHVPNGEYRPAVTGVKLQAMGVKPGVPDICLPVPRGKYHGLYIELKSFKPSAKLSENQKHWIKHLQDSRYRVTVCFGWRSALDEIFKYLKEVKYENTSDN